MTMRGVMHRNGRKHIREGTIASFSDEVNVGNKREREMAVVGWTCMKRIATLWDGIGYPIRVSRILGRKGENEKQQVMLAGGGGNEAKPRGPFGMVGARE
ncbi:hypothetical protein ANO11243_087900 [Dothideomycetidae sp. 11243]|nr:hypothetical protein ANO11243_087900 [fungal sp. No.11243]